MSNGIFKFVQINMKHLLYAQDTKNLEMKSEVNVKVKVTQNCMHHSAITRGIHTHNLGFLPKII